MNHLIFFVISLLFATSSLTAMKNTEYDTQNPRRQLPNLNEIRKEKIPKYKSIHESVQHKCLESVKYYIEQGHINFENNRGKTSLMISAWAQNWEILKLLIDAKADLNLQDKDGYTVLIIAGGGYTELAKLLINTKADLNLQNNQNETALMQTVGIKSNPEVLELLINAKADLNLQNNNGYTALMKTCLVNSSGHFKCLKLLINAGANFGIKNKEGKSTLELVRNDNQVKIILKLLDTITSIDSYEKLKFICTFKKEFKEQIRTFVLALKVKEKQNFILKIPKPLKGMILLFVWSLQNQSLQNQNDSSEDSNEDSSE